MAETGALFTQLQKFVEKNDLGNVIKTASLIIRSGKGYSKAFHCKVVALIQLDRFEEALAAFQKFPEFNNEFIFEKTYCLYRLNRTEEALEHIEKSQNQNELAIRELKGQIYYRQERFEESYKILKDLMKDTVDEYDDERKSNLIACVAQMANQGKAIDQAVLGLDSSSEDSFEVIFNTACYLMSLRKIDDAEMYLSKAEKMCLASLEEDSSDTEAANELSAVKTQLACCKHFQKKIGQALKMYTKILENKPANNNVIAVANNNILSANLNRNTFEMKKKVKLLQSETFISKLTTQQKRVVSTNIHLTEAVNASSEEEGMKICENLANESPDNIETVVLLEAAVRIKFNNTRGALETLEKHLKSQEGSKLKMVLAITQLHLNSGNYKEACLSLRELGEDMFRPGIASALVTILIALGESDNASDLLKSAAVWSSKNLSSSREMSVLWQQAGDLHLKRGRMKPALECLLQSLQIEPTNYRVIAKLTLTYTKLNNLMAFEFCERLKERIDLKPKSDLSNIEDSDWLLNLKANNVIGRKEQSPGTPLSTKNDERHRRKKKKKLPKNYDPDVSPDPERWLPINERSYFKKKKDRRNKEVGKGSQGANSAATDQYDITKMVTSRSLEKPASSLLSESHKAHSYKMTRHKKKKGSRR